MKKSPLLLFVALFLFFSASAIAFAEAPQIEIYRKQYDAEAGLPEADIDDLLAVTPYRTVHLSIKCHGAETFRAEDKNGTLDDFRSTRGVALGGEGESGIGFSVRFQMKSETSGVVKVTATAADGLITTEEIEVGSVAGLQPTHPVTGIKITDSVIFGSFQDIIRMSMAAGETEEVYYQVLPDYASNTKVTVHSSNESALSVSAPIESSFGPYVTLTAHREGSPLVTFTTEDGHFTALCYVTVTKPDSGGSGGDGGGGGCSAGFGLLVLAAGAALLRRR